MKILQIGLFGEIELEQIEKEKKNAKTRHGKKRR